MINEQVLLWVAVSAYGLGAFAYLFGLMARSDKLFMAGLVASGLGFLPHTVSIGVRWGVGGVNPFFTISESLTLGVWVSVLLHLIVQLATRRFRALGVLVIPVAFALLGWAGTLRTDPATQIAPALQSGWLWVHIIGASTGFAAVLVAASAGLLFLLRARGTGGLLDRLPPAEVLDELGYRFVAGGFTLYGVMIVSGAFWANQIKGTFWNWDPVEIWSLISWLVYGIYLHLRVTMGWRGRRLAIYSLVAVAVMILSYWGIPFTMETFHTGFRIEH